MATQRYSYSARLNPQESIRDLRIRLGLTQEEFADALAITVSTVNRWENGHTIPRKLAWRAIERLTRASKQRVGGNGRQSGE